MKILQNLSRFMLVAEFRLRSSAISTCKPLLVRIGAACDYAQNNQGPITYLFALEIPENAERQLKDNQPIKLSGAIWISPVFVTSDNTQPSRIHVHVRFPMVFLTENCISWNACYRIREQLLMNLITSASNYMSRPGIVQLPVK